MKPSEENLRIFPNLKNKPYLVRVFSYNNSDPTEIRLDKIELDNLYQTLKNYKLL